MQQSQGGKRNDPLGERLRLTGASECAAEALRPLGGGRHCNEAATRRKRNIHLGRCAAAPARLNCPEALCT